MGVAVGGRGGVGGGELGGEEVGAAGAEDVVAEEQPGDRIQAGFGGLDGAGVVRAGGGVPRVLGVVRALVVHVGPGGGGVGDAAHPAAAVPAPDPPPVGIRALGGGVAAEPGAVAAGGVFLAGRLGGVPGGPVHDRRVHRLRGPQPVRAGDADALAAVSAGSVGELFEFEDAGVLRGLDLTKAGPDRGGLGVAVGGRGGVGGGGGGVGGGGGGGGGELGGE